MSPILVGLDGVRRMGKSLGNYIGISEPPYEMMKKFMQLPDACMRMYFELLTAKPLNEIETLLQGHPKDAKMSLAKSVIASYYDTAAGDAAAERWQNEIGGKALPAEIPVSVISRAELQDNTALAAPLLKLAGLCPTMSDARRVIQQRGAYLGEEKTPIESHDQRIEVTNGLLLWVGKKRFCQVEIADR
jgi:tyrosyl-tRNA synthetase